MLGQMPGSENLEKTGNYVLPFPPMGGRPKRAFAWLDVRFPSCYRNSPGLSGWRGPQADPQAGF
jgi:hypothetical protein